MENSELHYRFYKGIGTFSGCILVTDVDCNLLTEVNTQHWSLIDKIKLHKSKNASQIIKEFDDYFLS
jgi:hypothetical protein